MSENIADYFKNLVAAPRIATTLLAELSATKATTYRYTWRSNASKNPRHLRFGADRQGQIGYMRDGILTLNNGTAGTYTRLREFAGVNHDEHEVVMKIDGPIFDGIAELQIEGVVVPKEEEV